MLRNVLLQQEDAFNDMIILKGNLLQKWSTWVKNKKKLGEICFIKSMDLIWSFELQKHFKLIFIFFSFGSILSQYIW